MADTLMHATKSTQQYSEIKDFLTKYEFPLYSGPHCLNRNHEPTLVVAARLGLVDIAKKLIVAGADVNQRDEIPGETGGHTPLLKASQFGWQDMVNFLLTKKPDLDIRDNQGATALYRAAQNGYANIVRQLIENNANPHIYCQGITPLLVAIIGKHAVVIKVLFMAGSAAKEKILGTATAVDLVFNANSFLCLSGKITAAHQQLLVHLLFEYGMAYMQQLYDKGTDERDINRFLQGELQSFSNEDEIKLIALSRLANKVIKEYQQQRNGSQAAASSGVGALQGSVQTAKVMPPARKSPVPPIVRAGNSDLHLISACTFTAAKYMELFDICCQPNQQTEPLCQTMTSAELCNMHFTRKNDDGLTPIHAAVVHKSHVYLKALIDFCIDKGIPLTDILNTTDKKGATPLMYACTYNLPHIAELLLKAGVEPNCEDEYNNTALLTAYSLYFVELVSILKRYNASFFCIDNTARNPFDYVCEYDREDDHGKREVMLRLYNLLLLQNNNRDGVNAIHIVAASNWCTNHYSAQYEAVLMKIVNARKILLQDRQKREPQQDFTMPSDEVLITEIINQKDAKNRTPIDHAFFSTNFSFIEFLLSKGAAMPDLRVTKEFIGGPPLCIAIANKAKVSFINFLLQQPNIDINSACMNGNTALHFLLLNNDHDVIELALELLKKGADPSIRNNDGKRSIDIYPDIWNIIISKLPDAEQRARIMALLQPTEETRAETQVARRQLPRPGI